MSESSIPKFEGTGAAIVTGSAQGIGQAIALRLAKDGYHVVLNDLPNQEDKLRETQQEILSTFAVKCTFITGDVSKEEDVKNLVETAVKEFGDLAVMIANAGILMPGNVVDLSLERWEKVISINLGGVFLCYKHAAKQMLKQGRGGRIVGASSVAGKLGLAGSSGYCASKFAVRGLTQTLAQELGASGITVNAYAPGVIDTPMLVKSGEGVEDFERFRNELISKHAIPRIGYPEDIANVVSFLCSKESSFITGQAINVNGGWHFD